MKKSPPRVTIRIRAECKEYLGHLASKAAARGGSRTVNSALCRVLEKHRTQAISCGDIDEYILKVDGASQAALALESSCSMEPECSAPGAPLRHQMTVSLPDVLLAFLDVLQLRWRALFETKISTSRVVNMFIATEAALDRAYQAREAWVDHVLDLADQNSSCAPSSGKDTRSLEPQIAQADLERSVHETIESIENVLGTEKLKK